MLTTASQFTPRARSLQTRHTASIRALGVASIRHPHQTRAFRFGLWPHCLDEDVQREIRRRQRILKHKYGDRINRRLSWDKHPFAEDARHALKRMVNSYWHSHDAPPSSRFCDDARPNKQRTPENKDGVRPGRNIEDVERGALDHLIFRQDEEPQPERSPAWRGNCSTWEAKSSAQTNYGLSIDQGDFVIDPITNRKVAKHPTPNSNTDGGDIPVKTFKDYRSRVTRPGFLNQVKSQDPVADLPSTEKFRKSSKLGTNPNSGGDDISGTQGKSDPIARSDGYEQNHGSVDHKFSQFDDAKFWEIRFRKARSQLWQGISPQATSKHADTSKESPKYDDLHQYRFVPEPERDGQPLPTAETLSKQFDDLKPPHEDLAEYESKYYPATEEFSKRLDEVIEVTGIHTSQPPSYGTATGGKDSEPPSDNVVQNQALPHNEPDGKPLGFKEEPVKSELLRKYQSSIDRLEPGDFPESTIEGMQQKYGQAELKQYTAVRYLEPDGNPNLTAEELRRQYHDLDKHGPVMRNEPSSRPPPSSEEPSKQYDPEELAKYKPYYYNEPGGKPASSAEELNEKYTSSDQYDGPVLFNEPDNKPPPAEEEPSLSKRRHDSQQYGPIKHQEADGPPAAQPGQPQDGLEELDALTDCSSPARIAPKELDPADESGHEVLQKLGSVKQGQGRQSRYRQMLDSVMERYERLSDAADREANLAIRSAKTKAQQSGTSGRTMTGNYVRDFPEEFEKSWTQTLSSVPTESTETYSTEIQNESENMDGGLEGAFGHPTPSKIQPALDRQPGQETVHDQEDLDSKHPRDVEATSAEEILRHTPLVTEQYCPSSASGDTGKELPREASPSAVEKPTGSCQDVRSGLTDGPTLYKVLAYDATMQKITLAETTSLVPDFVTALSPADALLRLSHPTKFFPHFAALEAEGFEIVSGSGDVLIFRKARPSSATKAEESSAATKAENTPAAADTQPTSTPINPIDMTGLPRVMSPASANFASPTGYVTYENLPENEASKLPPPPPRIKYNIDLRREEPVYSGPKFKASGGQKPKKNLGRRLLVGGVWVAGLSYGLGVVSEYFTTGGVDGMGPKGF